MPITMKKYFYFFFNVVFFCSNLFILFFLNNFNNKLNYDKEDDEKQLKDVKPVKIEIIIHGSFLASIKYFFHSPQKKHWSKKGLMNQHFNYQKRLGVRIVKSGMQELLLSDITGCENTKILKYMGINNSIHKNYYPDVKYFIFNWSGVLGKEDRRIGSFLLYKGIRELKELYPNCLISIIAYSHGGNVALGIAEWAYFFGDDSFQIDYLFLMGTPIGRVTKEMAMKKNKLNKYIFNVIVNFYHQKDYIQIMDFSFDLVLNRKLNICREGVYNFESIVCCRERGFDALKWYNWFEKLKSSFRSYHIHFLEDDFFSNDFIEVKKNIERGDLS